MRGLETKSATQRNGRGPDSSLKGVGKYVYVDHDRALRTVAHYNPLYARCSMPVADICNDTIHCIALPVSQGKITDCRTFHGLLMPSYL